MHEDAQKNYNRKHLDGAVGTEGMSDRAVVLTFWGNTPYRNQTGETNFDNVSTELWGAWSRIAEADRGSEKERAQKYKQLRKDFEENGWYGSPTK